MIVKNIRNCPGFTANDGCLIREILHPKNDPPHLPYSLAHAQITSGQRSYKHRLKQSEVYFILQGSGTIHIDDEARTVNAGDTVYIPPAAVQWIENTSAGDLEFLALVSPPWSDQDDIRIE
ncbi:MAG: cupin domain-containing protein [Thiotrichales bacterium]|nr:cupin domain-containing protein [Thiotrichales bacterium]